MTVVDLERTLRADLPAALRARRPPAPADLGRRALAAPATRPAPALAAALLVAAAAAATLVWRADPSVSQRPVATALPGGGESGAVRRLHVRLRALRRTARALTRDAALLSRRAAEAQERAEEALRDIDAVGADLRRVRREESGAAPLERAVTDCGDDPLCPLAPGPELVDGDPDPGPDFTVERVPAPRPAPTRVLTEKEVSAVLAFVSKRLVACARQAGATGVVMLTVTVAADGTVAQTSGGRIFRTCAGNVLHSIHFAPPGAETEVVYPITVTPAP